MIRTLAGATVGLLVAGVVLSAVNLLGHQYYPLPATLNYDDLDAVRHFVNGQPLPAMAFKIAAFLAAGFSGGLAAGWIAGPGHPVATMVPALAVAGSVVAMHRMAPHPMWVVAIALGGALVLGWAGAGLGGRLRQPFLPKPAAWKGGSR
jgi:hypothetical protein